MKNHIHSAAESYRSEMAELLREIIAIPSPSGGEGAVIERLKSAMEGFGFDEVRVDAMGNLIGRIGKGSRLIAIDGHVDTVGVGNEKTWDVDPYEGDMRNGVVFGRGAADQKGGVTSAIFAGRIVQKIGLPEDVSLLVVASVCEEDFEGLCWQHLVMDERLAPEAVLLTEPTNMEIKVGQRGRLELQVKTTGTSCHGSAPERGDNAIYKLPSIIEDIKALNGQLESTSILGKGTVTVTDVRSTSPSLCAVADSALVHLDRRLTHEETLLSALAEVRNLPSVMSAGAEVSIPKYTVKSYTGLERSMEAYYPAWLMERSDPLVMTAIDIYKSSFGNAPELGVWQFSTNGVATRGIYGFPTIGFGPGVEEHAHTPYDQVKLDDMVKATEFYAAFALGWNLGETAESPNGGALTTR